MQTRIILSLYIAILAFVTSNRVEGTPLVCDLPNPNRLDPLLDELDMSLLEYLTHFPCRRGYVVKYPDCKFWQLPDYAANDTVKVNRVQHLSRKLFRIPGICTNEIGCFCCPGKP